MRTILILTILMLSCGTSYNQEQSNSQVHLTVAEKFLLYKTKSLEHADRDNYGMFNLEGSLGDSVLFSCLHQFATGVQIDIMSNFSSEGLPLRHPEITKEYSATPISRDMLIGFMMCAISSPKGSEVMSKLISAGVENNWDMCGDAPEYNISLKDRLGRCVVSPGLISTMYRVRTYLGGECNTACKAAQLIPTGIDKDVEGFRRHLTVLHLLIRGLTGGISDNELDILQYQAENQPNNAMYQAAYNKFKHGQQAAAAKLLLNTNKFPEFALPSSNNYCTDYLYQRDESSQHDWLPCNENKIHTGIDFLFAARLIL